MCERFFRFPGIFKLVQAMACQAILGVRAYNLSRKSPTVGYLLACAYVVCCTFEGVTTIYGRRMMYTEPLGNCSSIGPHGQLGGWVYYNVAFIYDFVVTMTSIIYLLKLKPTGSSVMSRVSRMMLVDGLGYFLVLALANLSSLAFYRTTDIKFSGTPENAGQLQTAVASLGYCLRWVMSQKLIIHLHEASVARREDSMNNIVTRDGTYNPQFTSVKTGGFSLTVPDFESSDDQTRPSDDTRASSERHAQARGRPQQEPQWEEEEDHQVEVRIERTMRAADSSLLMTTRSVRWDPGLEERERDDDENGSRRTRR
ncbi:hypothetical protein MIND_00651200 [Mycena indigotica]|uniref:Uncharacterized protein n=1 Tax=Mycena indigotica TaxID=2126181 RepID=A0A8H6SRJ1_9AGAR|nr:uncharacterized protein MIND_00651200 [Mycena indigotica]KAF7304191.1 hypothetical protein MIND_00651200 [Mycena indigotica]